MAVLTQRSRLLSFSVWRLKNVLMAQSEMISSFSAFFGSESYFCKLVEKLPQRESDTELR